MLILNSAGIVSILSSIDAPICPLPQVITFAMSDVHDLLGLKGDKSGKGRKPRKPKSKTDGPKPKVSFIVSLLCVTNVVLSLIMDISAWAYFPTGYGKGTSGANKR